MEQLRARLARPATGIKEVERALVQMRRNHARLTQHEKRRSQADLN
jgi:hypothetical protein